MDVNKVEYNGDTLIDLTGDTVTPQSLLSGATAHDASGAPIAGAVDLSTKADKVASATSGNFAGLDANGNLTDSGKKSSDFEPLIFFGTMSEWNALTDAEKAKYRTLKIPDTRVSDIEALIPSTATSSNKLATAADLADKVDKIAGKGLSTEDYTTAEKTKLSGIAAGATANTVISTTVTLAANSWVGNAAPYTQTVNVTGILATDEPVLDVSISDTVATGLDEIEQFGYISKAVTGAGTITFSCYEDKPDIALTVKIKVVR